TDNGRRRTENEMKVKIAVVIILGLVPIHLFHAVGTHSSVSAQQPTSVWGGIYTEDQAKRGAPLYAQRCSSCHGGDLTGGEMSPALADSQFQSNWNGISVGDLFERIRVSMPMDSPGSLSRQQYADILAFILSKG